MGREYIEHWNRSWFECQIIRQLLTLDAFLTTCIKKSNIVYFNLSMPLQPLTDWTTLRGLQDQAINHQRMVLFDNTYYSVNAGKHKPVDFEEYKWAGHHGADGNKNYYELVVKPKVVELNWI